MIHNIHGLPWNEKILDSPPFCKFSDELRILRKKLVCSSPNLKFVCISRYVYNEVKHFLAVPEEKLKIIPDPISQTFFDIKKNEIPGLIFYPARLIPRKNQAVLIKALHIIKKNGLTDFKLALTGAPEDSDYFGILNYLVEKYELSDNVIFLGKIPKEELIDLYSQASVLALTSLEETFSLVVGEAMATGTAVITSPVGMVPEVITNGQNGFIINPLSPKDIAEKLYLLLDDDSLRKEIGKQGKQISAQWRPEKVGYDLINYWMSLHGI